MSNNECGKWKKPDEVMRFHRLKKKLSKRMTERSAAPSAPSAFSSSFAPPVIFSSSSANSDDSLMEFPVFKRKFPFPIAERNIRRADETDESGVDADFSSHSGEKTRFTLLSQSRPDTPKTPTTFSNIINQLTPTQIVADRPAVINVSPVATSPVPDEPSRKKIPIDWSLKSKLRFMSKRPFTWSASMRTTEQVSAVTGFVRCLDPGKDCDGPIDLDTSTNSLFHRCCLFWQHPHLPWIPLFSRSTFKLSPTLVAAQLQIAETLHQEFVLAFKSLLQLVRTQKCPYFYIIGTQFHCLFRAAGMAGESEINALISPTTRGFRKLLEDEDIGFSMPLKKRKRQDSGTSQDGDSSSMSSSQQLTDCDSDEDNDVDDWMESDHLRKLTLAQKAKDRRTESSLDGSGDSLVMVTGMDVQGLFNLLVNCKNNMDRLPPTLVAPTAFQLATLRSCQVRDAVVQVDGTQLYSVQVEGPIMPHALSQMCLLLDEAKVEYSAAIATVKQTGPFTIVSTNRGDGHSKSPSLFFLKEYLSDCGLNKHVMSRLCESDPSQFGLIDSIEPQQGIL